MSLTYQLLQAKSDYTDALHRVAVGEESPMLSKLLAASKKRIETLEKQIADAKQNKDVPKNSSPQKKNYSNTEDLQIACIDCATQFTFSGKDQQFFKKKLWKNPTRCTTCRDVKKNTKAPGVTILCCGCKKDFLFSEERQLEFEEKGWTQPKWCSPCKTERSKKATK